MNDNGQPSLQDLFLVGSSCDPSNKLLGYYHIVPTGRTATVTASPSSAGGFNDKSNSKTVTASPSSAGGFNGKSNNGNGNG